MVGLEIFVNGLEYKKKLVCNFTAEKYKKDKVWEMFTCIATSKLLQKEKTGKQ